MRVTGSTRNSELVTRQLTNSMAVSADRLRSLPLLVGLDDAALAVIAPQVVERTLAPGQVVILEGEPCRAVYFVGRGVVRTRRTSLKGREQVLAYLGPGEMFNLVPALDGGPNLATVDAVTEATLLTIPCEQFSRMLREHPRLVQATLTRLAAEVRHLTDMVEDLALHTVRTRLARFLLASAGAATRQWTQEEIAAQIGTVREMVGRTLRDLAAAGLVRRERGRVVVGDREGLEREAAA